MDGMDRMGRSSIASAAGQQRKRAGDTEELRAAVEWAGRDRKALSVPGGLRVILSDPSLSVGSDGGGMAALRLEQRSLGPSSFEPGRLGGSISERASSSETLKGDIEPSIASELHGVLACGRFPRRD